MQSNGKHQWNVSPASSRVSWVHPKHSHTLHTTDMVLLYMLQLSSCEGELVGQEVVYLQVSTRSGGWVWEEWTHNATNVQHSLHPKILHRIYMFFPTLQRGILSNRPSALCNSTLEGRTVPVDSDTLWLCRKGRWLAYRWEGLYQLLQPFTEWWKAIQLIV